MTLDEKLNLIFLVNFPLCMADGLTGLNGTQLINECLTAPGMPKGLQMKIFDYFEFNTGDLDELAKKYADDQAGIALVERFRKIRPGGRQFISFPSGINVGASFNPETALKIGEAVGWELRNSGVDVCFSPNVDIMRDPLGGRNYEMYGEDPHLVAEMSEAWIKGLQSTGTAACAKHFIANNQETMRDTTDNHIPERALREIYSRGFMSAVLKAKTKMIMSAYNAVNGVFSSYNKKFLVDWLRGEWGFDGVVISDSGAVKGEREKALDAGLDMVLSGPRDFSDIKRALEDGRLSMAIIDEHVERIQKLIATVKADHECIPAQYNQEELLQIACNTIVDGAVLLKNDNDVLPLKMDTSETVSKLSSSPFGGGWVGGGTASSVAFYGKRSKDLFECGTGSTEIPTNLHSNPYDETIKRFNKDAVYETMSNVDVLIYTVAATSGENIDRKSMDIEEEDQKRLPMILKEAKEKNIRTVVLLNIAAPVDMREWIDYADAVLCIWVPGCMGGVASADLLFGKATPGGKLPVTFPVKYEDTPAYPNFPGEATDAYYGEGIFVGYRWYDKRKMPVQYPFGYGLSYTTFAITPVETVVELVETTDHIDIPVKVKNTGNFPGSEVVQIYSAETKPHIRRPVKELVGFSKVYLDAGKETIVKVRIEKDALKCFDLGKNKWVQPVGEHILYIGNSATNISFTMKMTVQGKTEYGFGPDSTMAEVLGNDAAFAILDKFSGGMLSQAKDQLQMVVNNKLGDMLSQMLIRRISDTTQVTAIMQGLYAELGKIEV
ncbi:MAG: glycoside hydrolase family 3 C-terminal domain-containing protein [Spirochaetaceae bacterium]|jgi:beta-glucosidase|nr:glycoside hydrolase family 3 C-terminal domain-containing protein [Spirochaetaceae bacterium]